MEGHLVTSCTTPSLRPPKAFGLQHNYLDESHCLPVIQVKHAQLFAGLGLTQIIITPDQAWSKAAVVK